jgi:hypothetical protein
MRMSVQIILLSFLLAGCANLKSVNDFASASLTGVQGFESLPYSFKQNCLALCEARDLDSLKFNTDTCKCLIEIRADSADYLMYKTLSAYLDGLQKLSANELTTYHTDSLTNQLALLHVPSEQSAAYAKIGGILSKAVTDGYRRKKIRLYIQQANGSVILLIYYMKLNISQNLLQVLNNRETSVKSDYFHLLKKTPGAWEKRQVIEAYYAEKTSLDKIGSELLAYSALLQTIADGHQQLMDASEHLDKADLKNAIGQYASQIKDLYTQIQLIRK